MSYNIHDHQDEHLKYFKEIKRINQDELDEENEDNYKGGKLKPKGKCDHHHDKKNWEKVMFFLDMHGNV